MQHLSVPPVDRPCSWQEIALAYVASGRKITFEEFLQEYYQTVNKADLIYTDSIE